MDNEQKKYIFEITKTALVESVYFENFSDEFVEVVISADGKDIKTGKKITAQITTSTNSAFKFSK